MKGADIENSLAIVLIVCILSFTMFPRVHALRERSIAWAQLRPVLCLTLSSLLQVAFIALVAANVIRLESSLKFAALGLPICIVALALKWYSKRSGTGVPHGTVACSVLGLVMWLFLVTAH